MHAALFVRSKTPIELGAMAVLVGEERYWKRAAIERIQRQVLGEDDDNPGLTRFVGDDVDLKTVSDELFTVSMFGGRRLVLVDDADKFVSQHREGLEKYLQKPAKKSLLVLDVKSWPKTTRLAKALPKSGLEIDCSTLSGAELTGWLAEMAKSHGKTLSRAAASLIVELAGSDLGLLEQEIAKLAAYAGTRNTIEADDVETLVGGWTTQTTWAIAAAIRQGRPGEAIELFDSLLRAGESAHKILGGLTFVFRRIAQAVERTRDGESLDAALRSAGVFPREVGESAAYLRRLGRADAVRIYERLMTADSSLKGAVIMPERFVIESLAVSLSTSGLSRAE